MKTRFPLSAQILLWCFLNLVFLGAVFYLFFKIQFGLGLNSLLAGRAGERIEAVAEVILDQMRATDPTNWTALLQRMGSAYHLQFYLFSNDAREVAGDPIALPAEVAEKIRGPFPFRPLRGRVRMIGPRPPARQEWGDFELRPRFRAAPPQRPTGLSAAPDFDRPPLPGPPPFPELPNSRGHPKLLAHTFHPSRYWVLVRLPAPRPPPLPFPPRRGMLAFGGLTLVAMSESISGGGLLFDFIPWVEVAFGALLASVLFWFPLVRGITRSISKLTAATEQIAEGRFDVRIGGQRPDELGLLSNAINRMAERLAGFVQGQKRFLSDIAHELCSPLARAQMALSILERRSARADAAHLEDLAEEIRQMSDLVNELLSFSKASLKRLDLDLKAVRVSEVIGDVLKREAPDSAAVSVEVDSALQILAEPELASRALANVLRNAFRYAGSAGPISIAASRGDGSGKVTIRVADCGPGVPEQSLAKIFDPFYRVESSRSRESGGAGLGLAIVKTCVEACRGQVSAKNRSPSGLEIDLKFNAAPEG